MLRRMLLRSSSWSEPHIEEDIFEDSNADLGEDKNSSTKVQSRVKEERDSGKPQN